MKNIVKLSAASCILFFIFVAMSIKNSDIVCTTEFGAQIFGQPDSLKKKAEVLNSLGVSTVRESILITGWPSNSGRLDFWLKNGYSVILNVGYVQQGLPNSRFCPSDSLNVFADKLDQILSRYSNIVIVVVENEEQNENYRASVNAVDYANELSVACSVAEKYLIPVTNGGITTNIARALTYRWLEDTMPERASWFLNKCIPTTEQSMILKKSNAKFEKQLRQADTLLNIYANNSQSYINVHLYFPLKYRSWNVDIDNSDTSAEGLSDIFEYLTYRTNKKVITNETGTVTTRGRLVKNVINAYKKENTDFCIWWSGQDTDGSAKPLHNADASLTRNGNSFKKSIK